MLKLLTVAAHAAVLVGFALPPAAAGEWRHREVRHVDHPPRDRPWISAGARYYYSHHPEHIPATPQPMTGTPVPIFSTSRPVVYAVPRVRAEWCPVHRRWVAR